ncbi:MAG: hypothetical protein AB7U83_13950 [Vicinamibacterales bacterium]
MPSVVRIGVVMLVLFAVCRPNLQAQGPAWNPAGERLLAPPVAAKNPYARLFLLPGQAAPTTAPTLAGARPVPGRTAVAPAVVVTCGTRLIPIDPAFDAGIRRLPDAHAPRPTVRAVEPTLCR